MSRVVPFAKDAATQKRTIYLYSVCYGGSLTAINSPNRYSHRRRRSCRRRPRRRHHHRRHIVIFVIVFVAVVDRRRRRRRPCTWYN